LDAIPLLTLAIAQHLKVSLLQAPFTLAVGNLGIERFVGVDIGIMALRDDVEKVVDSVHQSFTSGVRISQSMVMFLSLTVSIFDLNMALNDLYRTVHPRAR